MPRGPKPAKSKEAKSTVARKSSKDDGARVRDLAEARAQQRATAEILRVIGSSPTDVQPVFDKIALNAVKVCDAAFCAVFREDSGLVHLVAHHNFTEGGLAEIQRLFPMSLQAPQTAARLIVSGKAVHIADVLTDERIHPGQRRVAEVQGYRGFLGIPMLRDGKAIGAIAVARREVGLFSESQVELLQTFADQAVIAIENVRLFNETKEALERQTATSEILQVIASSPTDTRPVFDAIVANAVRICAGRFGAVMRLQDGLLHLAAYQGFSPEALEVLRGRYPLRREDAGFTGLAATRGEVVRSDDVAHDPRTAQRDLARVAGYNTFLAVPMIREHQVVGVINVARAEPFTDQQMGLIQTFADQAVIAIENVRLFTELETRNRDLTEALDRQTATAEILRVISQSQTDVQPVFDAIARSAVALCGGIAALVLQYDGEMLHVAGHHEMSRDAVEQVERAYPRRPGRDYPPGRALLERHVVHIPDLQAATEFTASTARQRGVGSMLVVPLLREGAAIGVISLARDVVGRFSAQQIEVLQTFADQAVIAIENVRLFNELQTSNRELTTALEQQTATSEILQTIAQAQTDVQPVFDTIVRSAAQLCNAHTAAVFLTDGQVIYH